MKFRLAADSDLPKLKAVYRKIIDHMNRNGLPIWDDVFPCEFFSGDIAQNRLYLLTGEDGTIAAAFALLESCEGEDGVKWENPQAKAVYLSRFGVNIDYLRRGTGSTMLGHAAALARQKNAEYLRLFVVDTNTPAINLYYKNGFRQAEGIYEEKIDGSLLLREYGFELRV